MRAEIFIYKGKNIPPEYGYKSILQIITKTEERTVACVISLNSRPCKRLTPKVIRYLIATNPRYSSRSFVRPSGFSLTTFYEIDDIWKP